MSTTDLLPPPDDDPLDADLTFDDVTMLTFAAVAIVCAAVLMAMGL